MYSHHIHLHFVAELTIVHLYYLLRKQMNFSSIAYISRVSLSNNDSEINRMGRAHFTQSHSIDEVQRGITRQISLASPHTMLSLPNHKFLLLC